MRIIVVFIVLLSLVLIEAFLEVIYKNTDNYKISNQQRIRLMNVPNDLEVVNIGSGPVYYGIDYTYCDRNGYNLATAPQNFEYGYKILRRFSSNLKPGATVIITVMAPMSFGQNEDILRKDYADRYYGILSPEEIDNYSIKRAFVVNHPLLFALINEIRQLFRNPNQTGKKLSIVEVWKGEFGLKNLRDGEQGRDHSVTFLSKVNLLVEMVKYCRDNQWNPVFVIPPIPETTRLEISEEFLNAFVWDNMSIVKEKVGEIKILNYYDDPRFGMDLFYNDIFLNDKGTEIFSKILFEEIYSQENGDI